MNEPVRRLRALAITAPVALGIVFAASGACGPVPGPPPPMTPVNACPAHPCGAFHPPSSLPPPNCNAGMCVTASSLDAVMVVNVPNGGIAWQGEAIAVPLADLLAAPNVDACHPRKCVPIPGISYVTGYYGATRNLSANVKRDLQNLGASTLPVRAEYRPLWPLSGATPTDAAMLGLPIPVVTAAGTYAVAPANVSGPYGTRPTAWEVSLAPGVYQRTLSPQPPFDEAYPPIVETLPAIPRRVTLDEHELHDQVDWPNDLDGTQIRTLRVVRDGQGTTLDGWHAYLRDFVSKRRVSARVPLRGQATPLFTLDTIGMKSLLTDDGKQKVELVVAPPDGSEALPTLANNVLVDVLATDPQNNPLHYPELPPPVRVEGRVVGPNGVPSPGELLFEDARTSAGSGRLDTAVADDPAQPFIHYTTRVRTDDEGNYAVTLPAGAYDVWVSPDVTTGLSTANVLITARAPDPPAPQVVRDKTLAVPARAHVVGTAVLGDGRPLAGASVVATAVTDPIPGGAPERLPRGGSGTTDATGAYALDVDPGVYDVTVRPPPASGFPWAASLAHAVGGGTVVLPAITVPAPIFYDLTVTFDYADGSFVMPNALVRAYVLPPAAPGATAHPAVLLGEWLTGADGRLQILLAPPQ